MDPNEPIGSIVVDPLRPNIVYAGSWRSGVFVSEDAGATWRLTVAGLRTRSVRALAISSDGETLYAATRGEGVFRLSTHDQAYFDSLIPTATPAPPTQTPRPTRAPTIAASPSASPVSSTPESSAQPGLLPCTGALLLAVAVFAWRRRP